MQSNCNKDCKDRHVGCRKDCPVWKEHEEQIQVIRKERAKETAIGVYQVDQIHRTKTKLRNHKNMRRKKR